MNWVLFVVICLNVNFVLNYQRCRRNVVIIIASHLPRCSAKIVLTRQNVQADAAKSLAVRIVQMVMKIGFHVNYVRHNVVTLVLPAVWRICTPVKFVILFIAVSGAIEKSFFCFGFT